jgi:hypothetical protein
VYENRKVKPLEIVLRREEERGERTAEGVNTSKINCKHICEYHYAFPCTAIICNKNISS